MIRIATDSAVDFEPAEFEKYKIDCIPLSVNFGEREYKENIDLSKEKFYELLEEAEELPRTAQPSPQVFIELIEEAKEAGDDIIIVLLSSGISGTYQSALAIKEMVGYERCFIVDSKSATGGQRMVVEYAAKLRDEGRSAEEIAEKISALHEKIVLYACMDTLENMYKGGRISHTVYKIGSFAHIKPIIQLSEDGKVEVPAKAMGMAKGIDFMCKKAEKQPYDKSFPFYVMYTEERINGEKLRDKLRDQGIFVPDERIIPVGAAIGTHVGAKACGLVYVKE